MSRQENRTHGPLNSECMYFQFMLVVSNCSNSSIDCAKTGMSLSSFLVRIFLCICCGKQLTSICLMIGKPALQINQRKGEQRLKRREKPFPSIHH